MSKSKEDTKVALLRAASLVSNLPSYVRIIGVDVPGRIGYQEYEATIFLYNAELETVSKNFFGSGVQEEAISNHPEKYFQYFTVNNMAVFQIIERAAALSGTEDSGKDETVCSDDITDKGACQDGMGHT